MRLALFVACMALFASVIVSNVDGLKCWSGTKKNGKDKRKKDVCGNGDFRCLDVVGKNKNTSAEIVYSECWSKKYSCNMNEYPKMIKALVDAGTISNDTATKELARYNNVSWDPATCCEEDYCNGPVVSATGLKCWSGGDINGQDDRKKEKCEPGDDQCFELGGKLKEDSSKSLVFATCWNRTIDCSASGLLGYMKAASERGQITQEQEERFESVYNSVNWGKANCCEEDYCNREINVEGKIIKCWSGGKASNGQGQLVQHGCGPMDDQCFKVGGTDKQNSNNRFVFTYCWNKKIGCSMSELRDIMRKGVAQGEIPKQTADGFEAVYNRVNWGEATCCDKDNCNAVTDADFDKNRSEQPVSQAITSSPPLVLMLFAVFASVAASLGHN